MKFNEPKVEIIRIDSKEVVFTSNTGGAGGVEYCSDSGQKPNPNCNSNYSYNFG